ncbi:hypothetical protein B0T25DRAFT_302418 [Lasiosphaeria hispida]|uniref:Uncharacterized protein n=1 Tax=Lasiosphaeria hispida TaxID=260671 RepID=A0AAJ0M938_9PEZI|nr:hypothetical protein B0T25DRAFT_302418 [Lasiosphaeria hispida]
MAGLKFKNIFGPKKPRVIEVEPTSSNVPSHNPTTEYNVAHDFGYVGSNGSVFGPSPSLLPIPENGTSSQSQSPIPHRLAPLPVGEAWQSTSDRSFRGSIERTTSVTTTRSERSSAPLPTNGHHVPSTSTNADRNHGRTGSSATNTSGFTAALRNLTSSRSNNPPPPSNSATGPAGTTTNAASQHEVKTSATEVRRCTKLLRRMFELRVEAWAMAGAHMTDEPRRLERVRQAELIFVDIKEIVDGWKRAPQSNWSDAEYQEVLWIAQTLGDPTWRFGQGAAAPATDGWRYEQGVAA